MLQPAFRNSGKLEFTITAEFDNPVGIGAGTETMTFELEAGLDYPANAGLPPTFTSIATFTTPALGAGAGTGTVVFTLTLYAEGHKGSTFFQAYKADMHVKNLTTGATTPFPFADRITLDTTEDLVLRWRFKASVAPDLPDQKFNVTHLDAHLEMPDAFHPYR